MCHWKYFQVGLKDKLITLTYKLVVYSIENSPFDY